MHTYVSIAWVGGWAAVSVVGVATFWKVGVYVASQFEFPPPPTSKSHLSCALPHEVCDVPFCTEGRLNCWRKKSCKKSQELNGQQS